MLIQEVLFLYILVAVWCAIRKTENYRPEIPNLMVHTLTQIIEHLFRSENLHLFQQDNAKADAACSLKTLFRERLLLQNSVL
jgi:hypothetical protein